MRYPLGLVYDSAKHLIARKLRGERRFAVTMSLDPLGGCAEGCGCAGRDGGAEESPENRKMLSVAECLAAVDECGAPIVAICGGEPLTYPEIPTLTREILARGKHLFLCTDGTLIRRRLHMIPPEMNFFWNVKLDGTQTVHDGRAARLGLFAEAMDGIKAAKNAGFFVTVTTTIYPDTEIADVAALYERLHAAHVDGYMLSPHYFKKIICKKTSGYFHAKMQQRFREASAALASYNLMVSPVYLEYLRGERELDCAVWGSPLYGPQGWSGPCYLLNDGYAKTYKELLDKTIWENYGRGVNARCETCMCHAGFETAALVGTNGKLGDTWKLLAWQLRGNLGERRGGAQSA